MNIVMMTNTYLPHVGGVARSVSAFTEAYRDRGHRVLVVAPVFPNAPADEPDVVRIPAIQNFNGSDFSVVLPVPGRLDEALDAFEPDIIHAHHPFLIGSTALRVAAERDCPLVFTHHTLYEAYTHYVPGDSPALKRFVVELSTSYANSADQVIAPSQSIADLLVDRGVETPIAVVPTGIDRAAFASGDGAAFRQAWGLDPDAPVMGHVGRLAEEKNLSYLTDALLKALAQSPRAQVLIVGEGAEHETIADQVAQAGVGDRVCLTGALEWPALADAYAAMDLFAFASHTETQGLVLAEAMAAGVPVVALDAPGAREVLEDGANGRLLPADAGTSDFAAVLLEWLDWAERTPQAVRASLASTAEAYSLDHSADEALAVARQCLQAEATAPARRDHARAAWQSSLRRVQAEWSVIRGMARAAGRALSYPSQGVKR